jgi:serralysin
MDNNIGIAYGAVIENAIGGAGDDQINGNQANNRFTGGDGADTFILADYSGKIANPTGEKTVVDTSVDTITDFETGRDKIDLTELEITYGDLFFDTSVAGQTTVKIDRDGDLQYDDFTFIVQGDAPVAADYIV